MATAVKTFTFDSTIEGFVFATTNAVGSRITSDGSPGTGCLQASISGKSKTDTGDTWKSATSAVTWETWGVPVGATVQKVQVDLNWKCSAFTTGGTGNQITGANIQTTGNTDVVTDSFPTGFSGTTAWATRTGVAQSIASSFQPSNTVVFVNVALNLLTGNSSSAVVTLLLDQIVVTVTYTALLPPLARHRAPTRHPARQSRGRF